MEFLLKLFHSNTIFIIKNVNFYFLHEIFVSINDIY